MHGALIVKLTKKINDNSDAFQAQITDKRAHYFVVHPRPAVTELLIGIIIILYTQFLDIWLL